MRARDELSQRLGEEVRSFQRSVDAGDDEIARLLGLNRTDLRCPDTLLQQGPSAPSRLATELGLTTGSVTAMLDRMEKAGHITRTPDPADRRKLIVQATPEIAQQAMEVMLPMVEDSAAEIADYTTDDLKLLLDFLTRARGVQDRHVQRLRDLKPLSERRRR
ncbi:MAG TPA: MarR family transcriptional regulator [Candidatus Limnocylindrales bacterium]